MRADKQERIIETLINKMFEIAGHEVTYADIKDRKDNWYTQWTMTEHQNKQWRDWGIKYLKKELKLYKAYAVKHMAWFDLMYGLKLEPCY